MKRRASAIIASMLVGFIGVKSLVDYQHIPQSLTPSATSLERIQFTSRDGAPLSRMSAEGLSYHGEVSLNSIPQFLKDAVICAEDKNFYNHHGTDWTSLLKSTYDNLRLRRIVRGGSTISEQVVKILHPRPRTIWSRWLELIEVRELEHRFSKDEIFEFYLNHIPFAHNRRGIKEGAEELFDRDLSLLSKKEMLTLVVSIRAPRRTSIEMITTPEMSRYLTARIAEVAERMSEQNTLGEKESSSILSEPLYFHRGTNIVKADQFIHFAETTLDLPSVSSNQVTTTIDIQYQRKIQKLLSRRLQDLSNQHVTHASLVAIDNKNHIILVWANAASKNSPGAEIDGVLARRQPGSTLKPFLYAMALEKGWTPSTLIDDSPLSKPVGVGLKEFRNYSGAHYGKLPLRAALGNSLNIPAIKTVEFVKPENLLTRLHKLGFESLSQEADFYGEGLALGDGEVSLLELTHAYTNFANLGILSPYKIFVDENQTPQNNKRIFSEEVSSLIGHILSDPHARSLEFGHSGLLNFPVQTAIKTGTSTDYRDAWAIGFSARFTIGVWMGNLDRSPMIEVTGAKGPALVLRSAFSELERLGEPQRLFMSPKLVSREICKGTEYLATNSCSHIREWYIPGTEPKEIQKTKTEIIPIKSTPALELPSWHLRLAFDPRIPKELQEFPLTLKDNVIPEKTEWRVDDKLLGITGQGVKKTLWPVERGTHEAKATVWGSNNPTPQTTEPIVFYVK